MPNTKVIIEYSNGATREFIASDELEKCINEGEMFSVTTMHSDINIEEEMLVSKMYVGNPVAAMGHMMMMYQNAQKIEDDPTGQKDTVLEVLTSCISLIKNEITSHQSGMSPVKTPAEPFKHCDGSVAVEDESGLICQNCFKADATMQNDNGDYLCSDCYDFDPDEGDLRLCPAINASCEHFTEPCDGELTYCTHPDNSDKEHEGNCTGWHCPLCTEGGG